MSPSASRDGEELDSQGDASSQPDTISIASRTSQNTLDSDKVGKQHAISSYAQFIYSWSGRSVVSPAIGPESRRHKRRKLWGI